MTTHIANCFCGSVKLSVTGRPVVMGYCHCSSCRHWSAAPVNAFTLWKPEALEVTEGAELIGTFNLTPGTARRWCTRCGGRLYSEGMGVIDVYAALLPTLAFNPVFHTNYAEAVLPIRDGPPKYKDFPKEGGGSGETLPE